MRAVKRVATVLILLIAVVGCGQKGALYRDHQDVSPSAAATPANTMVDSNEAQRSKDSHK